MINHYDIAGRAGTYNRLANHAARKRQTEAKDAKNKRFFASVSSTEKQKGATL